MHSVPHNVIKKGPPHGAHHGKTEVQKEYHQAWNAWKRCCKKVDSQGEHFTGIHDRFHRDPIYRESPLAIEWTEQKCKEWDELAKEDHTYHLTLEEKKRYQGQWYLTRNKAGKNGPMELRSDFRAAVLVKNRLHHASGEQVEERLRPNQQRRWHSSSSTSWWEKSEWNWKCAHIKFLNWFCYSWFRLQSIAIHCNRREVCELYFVSPSGVACVDRYTSHETLLQHFHFLHTHHIVAQGVFGAHSLHLHVIHDVTCLSVRCLFSFCLLLPLVPLFSLTDFLSSVLHINFHNVESTEIKPSQKRKSGRDMGKRKTQDSPWKTKRANPRWSQNWDPEARTSSRVW